MWRRTPSGLRSKPAADSGANVMTIYVVYVFLMVSQTILTPYEVLN